MKSRTWLGAAILITSVAAAGEPVSPGHLVLIGGGDRAEKAMRKFVELAGGPEAPIVLIPTASEEPETHAEYLRELTDWCGCEKVVMLPIKTREDAARPDFVEEVNQAGGIFFGGGDQSRITRALLGTPVGEAIVAAFKRGAAVGGTSAGTACQSALMITGEGDFDVVREGAVALDRGLGLFQGVIVDQHFLARRRENRLISAILEHPGLVGVGVDEDTAVWVKPGGTFEVVGERSVAVFDAGQAVVRKHPAAAGKPLLGVHDLRLHILLPGEGFDLNTRTPLAAVAAPAQ